MLNRRDIILASVLLVVFIGMLALLLVSASSLKATDGLYVSKPSIGVIDVYGPIIDPLPTIEQLEKYAGEKNIKAILIRLDTPGGGVSASQEIHRTVEKISKNGIPIIGSMGSVAASGGYYIASACDTIFANPGTVTASIGVILNLSDFSELYDKIGVEFSSRKTGKFKDTGSTHKELTDDEKAMLDSVIMDMHSQFVEAVVAGRNLNRDMVEEIADGRIVTGIQARSLGLIDEIGTYHEALDCAGVMGGIGEDPPTVEEQPDFWEEMMSASMQSMITTLSWFESGQFFYIMK